MRRWSSAGPRHGRCKRQLMIALLPIVKVSVAGLLVSACANSQAAYDQPSNMGGHGMPQVAVVAAPKVELEADGLAVQAPPFKRKRVEPDDPSEPFSRNYGPAPEGTEPAEPASVPVEPPRQAGVAPPILRSRITALSPSEQDAIVARAMAEHERRYP